MAKFLVRDAVMGKENVLFGIEITPEVRDAGLSLKMSGNAGSGPPFQTLLVVFGRSFVAALAM